MDVLMSAARTSNERSSLNSVEIFTKKTAPLLAEQRKKRAMGLTPPRLSLQSCDGLGYGPDHDL